MGAAAEGATVCEAARRGAGALVLADAPSDAGENWAGVLAAVERTGIGLLARAPGTD
ncbi:hypothetical protein JS756_27580 [Streptomyces actuosus]|uniref:Uncharacterized protein n=1 Tax=Streptomyces actuosus TaxID=1885 RepID=A0ABS2VXD1_STRAS|nr:hypothetical protein [Streptomyces actuosus]MBN0047803.1 hypothetical protein [Streptomyces actuosus]